MTIIRKIKPFNLDNNASFTFGNVTANGNVIANGNISTTNANLGNAATANFFIGNGSLLTGLPAGYANSNVASYLPTYTGNITSGNASLGNAVTANFFIGSGNNLSNIQAANITGTVANATTAGTVTTAAQPNITSVGTLTSITASGDATIGGNLTVNGTTTTINATTLNVADLNITLANGATTAAAANGAGLTVNGASATMLYISGTDTWDFNKTIVGNLTGLASSATVAASANAVAGANVSGEVTFAATANAVAGANVSGQVANALVAGTVYTNAQPNITSVGTLSSVAVTGNVTAGNANLGNLVTANFFSGNGSLLTGITVSAGSSIVSGNSNVNIPGANGNINFSAVGNANILVITGTGANITGTANITANLTTSNLTVTNKTNLGSNANITITGGTAGYALTTDGTGNLSWSAASGGAGGGLTYTAATTPPASGNVAGDQWFNTTANVLYEYINDGTSAYWVDIQTPTVTSATITTYVNRSYTGDGSTTTYTVTSGCDVNNILVFINGVCQMPTVDYTVSGSVLTMIPAAAAAAVIQVRELPR
jgi:hypothetical protein